MIGLQAEANLAMQGGLDQKYPSLFAIKAPACQCLQSAVKSTGGGGGGGGEGGGRLPATPKAGHSFCMSVDNEYLGLQP